ncbi:MAG TPA: MoaD/ThiS family protein, partial [Steroidobacteraceae bacterium]
DNINTAAEYQQARGQLDARVAGAGNGAGGTVAGPKRQLKIQYFALLREQAGRSEETITSAAADARALYAELSVARGLQLRPEQLRVAINEAFADWSQPLVEGDTVVFLPPVAGG